MRIKSPLNDLCETIEQVVDSASEYEATLRKNEAATRAVLIDPILRSLGWDTANTYMVEVEKTDGNLRADYALYDTNREVAVIIEAKALGTELTDRLALTLVNYAFHFSANQLFLTDGLIWRYYCDFRPGSVNPERVINLAKDRIVDSASFLVQKLDAVMFWPNRPTEDELTQKVVQLESEVATLKKILLAGQQGSTERPARTVDSSPSANNASEPPESATLLSPSAIDNRSYVDLDKIVDADKKQPLALRLPDGSEVEVQSWAGVLRECIKFALATNPSIPIPFIDKAGGKVLLLSTTKPSGRVNYFKAQYNDKVIFAYINYEPNLCVANALHILRQAPSQAAAAVAMEQRKQDQRWKR